MDDVEENITAWEAVQTVNDIAYCFTQTEAMDSGRTTKYVPHRYDFQQVLFNLLQNADNNIYFRPPNALCLLFKECNTSLTLFLHLNDVPLF